MRRMDAVIIHVRTEANTVIIGAVGRQMRQFANRISAYSANFLSLLRRPLLYFLKKQIIRGAAFYPIEVIRSRKQGV